MKQIFESFESFGNFFCWKIPSIWAPKEQILMHYTRENMGISREAEVPEEAVNQVGPNVQIQKRWMVGFGWIFWMVPGLVNIQLLYFELSPPWHPYVLLLANLLAFYLTYLLAFYLAYRLAFYLTCYLAVEVQRCSLSSEGPSLRPSGAHWARRIPGWGPAVLAELGRSQVEVQRCPVRSDPCSWGPAAPTACGSWRRAWRRVGKAEVDMEVDAEVVEEKEKKENNSDKI